MLAKVSVFLYIFKSLSLSINLTGSYKTKQIFLFNVRHIFNLYMFYLKCRLYILRIFWCVGILPRNRAKLQRKLLVCQQTVLFFSGFLLWPENVWLHLDDLYWSTKLTQRCTFQLVWLDINWRFSRHIGKEQKMIQKLGWPILAWLRLRCMQKLGYFLA